jgi:hypothetical protein
MADISKATHDTMIAAVKAVKDTYLNAFYIQRVLNTAIIDLNAAFLQTNVTTDALKAPVAANAISATSDPKVIMPGVSYTGEPANPTPAAPIHDAVKA